MRAGDGRVRRWTVAITACACVTVTSIAGQSQSGGERGAVATDPLASTPDQSSYSGQVTWWPHTSVSEVVMRAEVSDRAGNRNLDRDDYLSAAPALHQAAKFVGNMAPDGLQSALNRGNAKVVGR